MPSLIQIVFVTYDNEKPLYLANIKIDEINNYVFVVDNYSSVIFAEFKLPTVFQRRFVFIRHSYSSSII